MKLALRLAAALGISSTVFCFITAETAKTTEQFALDFAVATFIGLCTCIVIEQLYKLKD